jgi:hypothetical protein
MNTETSRCPKCNGEMLQGFVIDRTERRIFVSGWFEGAPKSSFWWGTSAPEVNRFPIGTFRCSACGFLESYARPEFAAR